MRNLDQVRAGAAIGPSKRLSRASVNKLPALIMQNGLLAASAFCNEDGGGENRKGMKDALTATVRYLASAGFLAAGTESIDKMTDELARRDSNHLQRTTTEALAFIAYLKRFSTKRADHNGNADTQ